jgi:hypothetical protein
MLFITFDEIERSLIDDDSGSVTFKHFILFILNRIAAQFKLVLKP